MSANAYRRDLALVIAVLVLFVGVLSILLFNNGPRVRFIQYDTDLTNARLTQGSTMTVRFDRPIEQQDHTDAVSITPSVAFTATTQPQAISIVLQENLAHDTEYTVTVRPTITDASGKQMRTAYNESFRTNQLAYAYIQRNADMNDKLLRRTINQGTDTIYEAATIRRFAINNEYAVVVTAETLTDSITIVNLDSMESASITLPHSGVVTNLSLSPFGGTALYTLQPELTENNTDFFFDNNNVLRAIDLASTTQTLILDANNTPLQAEELFVDRAGQLGLIQDVDKNYRIVSAFNDFDPILLGAFTSSFGFSSDGTEILFRDEDTIVRFIINGSEIVDAILANQDRIRQLASAQNTILSAASTFTGSLWESSITRHDPENPKLLWQSIAGETRDLRDFTPSYDGSLLAIQLNPNGCTFEQIGSNSQCSGTQIDLHDTRNNSTQATVSGFDVVWLP